MKTKVFLIAMLIILFGCSHVSTLTDLRIKHGPPAKIEEIRDTTTYFYYFYKGKVLGLAGRVVSAEVSKGWIVVEFIADRAGNVIETRKYWLQPKGPPK